MKKYIVSRAFFGFCIGVTLVQLIIILINFCLGEGELIAVIPQLLPLFRSERAAALVQTVWGGLIGVSFAEASLLFELERWGTLKQYVVHFFVTGVIYLPFVSLCYVPLRAATMALLLANILLTYGITYTVQIAADKKAVERINAELERRRRNEQP